MKVENHRTIGLGHATARTAALGQARPAARSPEVPQDKVTLSSAARAAATNAEAEDIAARLAAIKRKGNAERTPEEHAFVEAHDQRLAEIRKQGKPVDLLSSDDLAYVQKAGGFVNLVDNFSPEERALYDRIAASGDREAVAGMAQIALVRVFGSMAGGASGSSYDPGKTDITADNIEQFFSHSTSDRDALRALARYLRLHETPPTGQEKTNQTGQAVRQG